MFVLVPLLLPNGIMGLFELLKNRLTTRSQRP
jgi:urea transport system permease protein